MKNAPSGVCAEMLKAAGYVGIDMVYYLTNDTMKPGEIPTAWQNSVIINFYKDKGGATIQGN